MIAAHKIIVALDFNDEKKLLSTLDSLMGTGVWVKIGMEIFYSLGPRAIEQAKKKNFKIFLDLKLHDIPNTVHHGLKSLMTFDIDMINIHAAGGREMMVKASEAVKSSNNSPLLIAVTQLTSTSNEQMNQDQRILGTLVDSVTHFAKLAKESGCDGVVSSPLEVQKIKELCGSKFLTVTPGIRPKSSSADDQKRITTPMDAIKLGTDFIVIGRPITHATDPRFALEEILEGN